MVGVFAIGRKQVAKTVGVVLFTNLFSDAGHLPSGEVSGILDELVEDVCSL